MNSDNNTEQRLFDYENNKNDIKNNIKFDINKGKVFTIDAITGGSNKNNYRFKNIIDENGSDVIDLSLHYTDTTNKYNIVGGNGNNHDNDEIDPNVVNNYSNAYITNMTEMYVPEMSTERFPDEQYP